MTGEKGGVGKSFFARALHDFYPETEIVECDKVNQSLKKFYGNEIQTLFVGEDGYAKEEDVIWQGKKPIIMDLPAGGEENLKKWISELEIDSAEDFSWIFWFVSNGTPESLGLFGKSQLRFHAHQEILVLNEVFCNAKNIKEVLAEKTKAMIIVCPRLSPHLVNTMEVEGETFTSRRQKMAEQQRLNVFFRRFTSQISKLNLSQDALTSTPG